jgi:alpha-ketoglutarate-dependent taurine dioxygenase
MTIAQRADVQVRRLNTTFAAEVTGVDLSRPLDDAGRAEVWNLLLEHKVLFFRDQRLDADSQVAFARQFGDLTPSHPVMAPVDEEHPEIWQIDSSGDIRNDIWHTDVTFVKRPPKGSVLRAVRIPEIGGDTNWADTEAAYYSLTPEVRTLVDGLTAVHDGTKSFGPSLAKRRGQGNAWDGSTYAGFTPVEHPVVRVHPETGHKGLFVNFEFTQYIKGVSPYESRGILDFLLAHITKPEHIVRHTWSEGDVVLWDNRITAHYANFDYDDFRRVMQRVTWMGDVPFGPFDAR